MVSLRLRNLHDTHLHRGGRIVCVTPRESARLNSGISSFMSSDRSSPTLTYGTIDTHYTIPISIGEAGSYVLPRGSQSDSSSEQESLFSHSNIWYHWTQTSTPYLSPSGRQDPLFYSHGSQPALTLSCRWCLIWPIQNDAKT